MTRPTPPQRPIPPPPGPPRNWINIHDGLVDGVRPHKYDDAVKALRHGCLAFALVALALTLALTILFL